ncbi:MAG: hypothetical protein RLZZ618_3307 [Pseudomonadota bacterium]|jgi:hypothetical protein
MRIILLIISLIGFVFFGAALAMSLLQPTWVESVAREGIRLELERRVGARLASLDGGALSGIAARMSGKNAEELAELRREVAAGVPKKIASIVAQMRIPGCPCRTIADVEKDVGGVFERRALELTRLNDRLERFIRTQYMDVAGSLLREFRILTGANALVFALLGSVVMFRRRAGVQLWVPAGVLLGAAVLVGGLYVFNQNWLHTILFSDYVGWGYFAYLGVVIALLADAAFNKSRVITRLLNLLGSMHLVPC